MYYYNARWYDAQLGRFTQADTIVPDYKNPQDLNRYSYVRGNPIKHIDPSGHCPPSVPACRGADGRPIDAYYRYGDRKVVDALPLSGLNPWFAPRPGRVPAIHPSDNWWDLGWDWLLQQGPEERIFDSRHYMTQQLRNDLGVNRARDGFYRSDLSQKEPYKYSFSFYEFTEATAQGSMTSHFLGGYRVTIEQISDTELAFEVYNRTSRGSGTRNPFNPSQTLLSAQPRSEVSLGGNYDQYYVWTEPVLSSYAPPHAKIDPIIEFNRDAMYFSTPEGMWHYLTYRYP